jgi:hypothetical protein
MADFEPLTPSSAARWERWRIHHRAWQAAEIALVTATARARLAERVEARIVEKRPADLRLLAAMLRRRAAAADEVVRAAEARTVLRSRLARLHGSWRTP